MTHRTELVLIGSLAALAAGGIGLMYVGKRTLR